MFTRRSLIILLAAFNLAVAAALFASARRPAAAFAQAGVRPGAYLAVTAKPQNHSYSVLWVLDLNSDRLFAFYPRYPHLRELVYAEPRNLAVDFARQAP